jgi:lipopolysaccharide export system protein LptA
MAMLAGPAAAQLATNSRAPVDITADSLEVANGACTSIWRGHAEALQENSRLRADVLTAEFQNKGGGESVSTGKTGACGDLVRMTAQGSVYYVTPQQKVHGDTAVYEAGSSTLTVTGDVVAVQGPNVLRGSRMVFNTVSGQGHMEGSAAGRNRTARPRGVFYPKQSNAPAARGR